MHHFQLKPVRSLDSLRPAWSGHLRHGPPPSTVITNPREVPSKKPVTSSCSSSRSFLSDNSTNRSKAFAFNSLVANSNTIKDIKEVHKTSLLPIPLASYNRGIESNHFLNELHIRSDLIKPLVDVSSCDPGKENTKFEEEFSLKNKEFNSANIFPNTDSIPNTWNSEPFDKSSKTSNFLHEVNEDDPFDTSRVFMPTFLHTAPLFKSTIPSMSAQFHPLPHPFNTTSCSAHAKVNIIIHYFLCLQNISVLFSHNYWIHEVYTDR